MKKLSVSTYYFCFIQGRILNRFSKDVGTIDELLPDTLVDSVHMTGLIIGIMVQVLLVNWWIVFPIQIMGCVAWKLRQIFMKTAPNLWRLEAAGE